MSLPDSDEENQFKILRSVTESFCMASGLSI